MRTDLLNNSWPGEFKLEISPWYLDMIRGKKDIYEFVEFFHVSEEISLITRTRKDLPWKFSLTWKSPYTSSLISLGAGYKLLKDVIIAVNLSKKCKVCAQFDECGEKKLYSVKFYYRLSSEKIFSPLLAECNEENVHR